MPFFYKEMITNVLQNDSQNINYQLFMGIILRFNLSIALKP